MLGFRTIFAGSALALTPLLIPAGDLNLIITNPNATAVGSNALVSNLGTNMVAMGDSALAANTTGSFNTALGSEALRANTTGLNNVAVGSRSLRANTTGRSNTVVGHGAMFLNVDGFRNTAVGLDALTSNVNGSFNTAIGMHSLRTAVIGNYNTAVGYESLASAECHRSTALGHRALQQSTGQFNIAVGDEAGQMITTGSYNIAIGHDGMAADARVIRIGTAGEQTTAFMAGISNTNLASGSMVFVDPATGQLGTMMSTAAIKTDVADIGKSSDALHQLRPVTFRYEGDPTHLQFGLIAEEVAEHLPELVSYDANGSVRGVHYHHLAPMLLNEIQKQQRVIESLERRLQELEATRAK